MEITTRKPRSTFFDLPLELRQLVYDALLPDGPYISINDEETDADENLYQLRRADPRLEKEVWDYSFLRRNGCIIVSSDSYNPPSGLPYDKLNKIEIVIAYYRDDNSGLAYCGLLDRLYGVVRVLNEVKKLQNVTIKFNDPCEDPEESTPSECWYSTKWDWNDEDGTRWIEDCSMLTRGHNHPTPIYWDLLWELRDLPVCRTAFVERLFYVSITGQDYEKMHAMALGMELWLEGDREEPLRPVYKDPMDGDEELED